MSGTGVTLALVRHGATEWNTQRRIQGLSDVPLSPEGRAEVARWRLPGDLAQAAWYTSPLRRAEETALLLGIRHARRDPRLAEMRWGAWEGRTLADLRREHGPVLAENEARGFDFRPPGGESPREVLARFEAWLGDALRARRPLAAITHRGVIRAALAKAMGWDLVGKPPFKLAPGTAQLLRTDGTGVLGLKALNQPLDGRTWHGIAS